MLIAIDPDVFIASLTDSSCKNMLQQVFEHLDKLRVAVDFCHEIVSEYYNFLEKYIDTYQDHIAITLLQEILLERQNVTLALPTRVLPSLQEAILRHKCTTKVESELIGIVANAENLGLKLFLAGRGINAHLRQRCLNDPQSRRALQREIPWLDVHFASQRKELFPPSPTIHYNARIFELLAARFLQTQHPTLRCVETPSEVKNQLGKREEIDLYGYEQDKKRLVVWVGECKLREEGRENKPITRSEIGQLRRKMSAAKQYESSRTDLAGQSVQSRGLIISNAEDFFDDFARQEALETMAEFWHAELTSGWNTDFHWYIYELTRIL